MNTTRLLGPAEQVERAFIVVTRQGSRFACRFRPTLEECGVLLGSLELFGVVRSTGESLRIQGQGALPEVGGELVVSDQPYDTLYYQQEAYPCYPTEVIVAVREVPVPMRG